MKQKLLFVFLLFSYCLVAQNRQSPDQFAFDIPDSVGKNAVELAKIIRSGYPDDDGFVRALYVWICTNLSYDSQLVDSLKDKNLVEYALKTKTGKCKNFSAILTSMCNVAGIEAYSVLGYIKTNDRVQTNQDHAWNIIKIDGSYYLFDPTFDALKKTFDPITGTYIFKWYKKEGNDFISSHMPYDPMMQLLDYPLRHKDFFRGKQSGKNYFDYKQSLEDYRNLSGEEQLVIMLKRAEEYGINIRELNFLYGRLKHFVNAMQTEKQAEF